MDNKLSDKNTNCYLFNINEPEKGYKKITQPVYIKYNGIYGYLAPVGLKVFFIYYIDGNTEFEDVSHIYKVKYSD